MRFPRGYPISDRVTLLADVAEIVARSHDLAQTLHNVVELVAKRLGTDVCSVYLLEPDLPTLTLSATVGLLEEAVGHVHLPVSEGLVGLAAERRSPVVVERAREHPNYRYFPETGEERFASLMAVPLLLRGQTIGVLVVQTLAERAFQRHEVESFLTCAQLIAPIVVNARLISIVGESGQGAPLRGETSAQARAAEPAPNAPSRPQQLQGTSASRGIAIGAVYHLGNPLDLASLDYVPGESAESEERDLMNAVVEARRELDGVREDLGDRFGPDFPAILNAQVQILEDKGLLAKLRKEVRETASAFEALRNVLAGYRETFSRIEDPYFRDRILDVEDVGRRVMEQLMGEREHVQPLSRGAIVVTDNILPSHFARLEIEKVGAIVSEHGGPTSHGAIFARTLEIPAVTGVPGILQATRVGETAIVDGAEGLVHLAPEERLVEEYRRARQRYEIAIDHLDALRDRPAETADGRRIALTANCGLVSDLRLVNRHGAEGVGLFRTEMLALVHRGFPEEEEQEQLYKRVAADLAPRPLTIRTLDLGGDKEIANLRTKHEENPQLGKRSIRLSLANPSAFRAQLRAILRASAQGNVRMLLPMISSLNELLEAREIIEETKEQLRVEHTPFDSNIPVGVMIEVPSAALIADALAKNADFFSIGTNDLTQYTLAVDRGNEDLAHLYDPLHPSVLALIDRSTRAARRAGIPVSLCGEMASNPLAIPILLGIGIGELSGTPSAVPIVKEIVHALSLVETEAQARRACAAATSRDVHRIGATCLREAGLLEHPDIGPWLAAVVQSVSADH